MSLSRGCARILPVQRTPYHTLINTHQVFDEISKRDLTSLNSLLVSHLRNRDPLSTWNLFGQMHRANCHLSTYTFTPVLGACSALENFCQGPQVHGLMMKLGLDSGPIIKTALIDMYSKYKLLGNSVLVFEEMGIEEKDVIACNAMVSSFLRHGLPIKALVVFGDMRRERVEFNCFTICSVVKACAQLKASRQGKQAHAVVIVLGHDLLVLSTALIDFYSTIGCIDEALKIYSKLSCQGDDMLRNSLISACHHNKKYDIAMSIVRTMRTNMIALTSGLAICSENSNLWIGKQIHCVIIRQSFSDTKMWNALIDMYAKCGEISNACLVFDQTPKKDVVSWTSMIDAYGCHGYGHEALKLFKKMEGNSNVLPNSLTMLAILSACGHSGLIEQGKEFFASFKEKYYQNLELEHYSCFMDILGRAGLIEEVWSLFHEMVKDGIELTCSLWAVLLNACLLNRDFKRGDDVAKKLLELEPNKSAYLVAVSNFYAASGKWDLVDDLRGVMKYKGVAKEHGNSWVTAASCSEN